MSLELDEYRQELIAAAPELADTLEPLFHEAARLMSPQGVKDWLDGARGLTQLGKGPALITAWLDSIPRVVRDCGEDVIRDCAGAIFKLSSMTSGEVLALALSTLPTASSRLSDQTLLRAYLQLLHRLAAKAPRGLRPMFGVLDELLGKLTLSGLQHWIDFGAEAYRRDLPKQADYFGLRSDDSKAVLEAERRGTLFVDSQRKLNFYLRAFWARDFFLRPAAANYEGFRPFIEDRVLHLPDAVDEVGSIAGIDVYRAMAAHMAAHMVYTLGPEEGENLSPAQRFFIGFVEDARVEYLAAQEFPGMKSLWRGLIAPTDQAEHQSVPLLELAALALLDPDAKTEDEEVDALADRFASALQADPTLPHLSRDTGLQLFDLLARRRAVPSLRILENLNIPYRDDNRFLWMAEEFDWDSGAGGGAAQSQVRKHVGLMEFINEIDTETAGDDAQEIWTLSSELFPYEDEGVSYNEMEGKEPISEPFGYPEWDYQTQLLRPAWATLYERRQARGDPDSIREILTANKGVSQRIKQIIDKLRPQGLSRQRKLEDGDELDLNAAVEALVMVRSGMHPDPRITMRNAINRRDLAVVILLDLSESTNEMVRGTDKSVLELTREASALIATAIEGIGDPYAIHGFASDGRHDVQYYRFKDFDQHLDDEVRSRLAGMRGGLSTRMGAAIRHAGHHLLARPEKHKLLLVITDGEPADIDERDPQYLRMDARKSVEELNRTGVTSYCLTLDPHADRYVERIFGVNRYTIIDRVQRLPEKLPLLFANLTR
ncbi:MAG: nitric oxide reductase activation protein NorD [Hyphomicrobiaceae bacterium]|nr:nitric oxide reductase activation protein NorD [Hyphomicrobiaceae bacterium]